jgi:hypothetical protein
MSAYVIETVPVATMPYCVFGLDERRVTYCPATPFSARLVNVEVALARNCAEVLAFMVRVSVVLAAFAKMTDWVVLPVWLVLVIWRLAKALVPVMVPERVCWEVPLRVVVPEPAVKAPLFA